MVRMISGSPRRSLPVLAAAVFLLVFAWSCDIPDNAPLSNSLPDTRLANVPDDDTIGVNINRGVIPEQTLYWTADDPDGYIVGYRFRWIDEYRDLRDTTPWTTLLNLTSIGGAVLDTFIQLHPNAPSAYRVYNFLATIRASDQETIRGIQDRLATRRYFAVPYTTGPVPGDSIIGTDPVLVEAPNKGTFIFNSPADSNRHRFEVKGIDNSDADDPTPATVYFWTRQSEGPIVFFPPGPPPQPDNTMPRFIIRCPTFRNPGLIFHFGGFDRTTEEREYSWTVDDSTVGWSPWNVETFDTVTAADLRSASPDSHIIYLRGRNRWGVISQVVWRYFRAITPVIDTLTGPSRILLYNNTRDRNYSSAPDGAINRDSLMTFYMEVLDSAGWAGRYDTLSRTTRFPRRIELSKYHAIVFVADAYITPPFGGATIWQLKHQVDSLREYLNYGGKMVWSGSPKIASLFESSYPAWANQFFHLSSPAPNPLPSFVGARGRLGYPDIAIDTSKVRPDSLGRVGLRDLSINLPQRLAVAIYDWRHRTNDPFYEGYPVGVRYNGSQAQPGPWCRETYSVVFFGFPLYYMQKAQAIQAMRKALEDLRLN